MRSCTHICSECPFRRSSAPGWLGDSSPEEFIDSVLSENDMPCHLDVDYDDENWRDRVKDAKRCTGSLVFFRNNCKLPRSRELCDAVVAVEPNRDMVFSFRHEFLDHHNGVLNGKKRKKN